MFDLHQSPFYLLGVSPRDDPASIAQATENAISEGTLDEASATRAQQILMSPRLRLGAEVSWLTGLAPNRVRPLVEGQDIPVDAIAGLPLLAGANLAAYRCSCHLDPTHHELLFRFHAQRDDTEILTLINSERRVAKFPEVPLDLLQEVIPELIEQHIDSFMNFLAREPWPGKTLLAVLRKHFVDGSNVVEFLDNLTNRFDSWASGTFQQAEEAITKALNRIKENPSSLEQQLSTFSSAIGVWASVAAPHQHIFARRHVNDPRTEHLLSNIRTVCLYLNNDLNDAKTPLALAKAAAPAFQESPGHLDIVKADLKTLEERAAENEALAAVKPLVDFVTELKPKHREICRSIREGHFGTNGHGIAGTLFERFQTAAKNLAGSAAGAVPFRITLSLAIDLHNESDASEEALILIRALERFSEVPKDQQLVEDLRSNGLVAHRTVLGKSLAQAAKAGKNRQSARLAQQLVDIGADDEDRAGWQKAQAQFEHRAKVQTWKYSAIAVAIGGFVVYATVQDSSKPSHRVGQPTQYRTPTAQDYNDAVRRNPQNATAYYNRGHEYANNRQYDNAISDYNDAVRLNPSYAAAYHGRAIAYANKKQYTLAIEDYTRALRLDPRNSTIFFNRGLAYANSGQNEEAIRDYTEAVSLNPQNASAYNNRGLAYSKEGELDKAIADYNQSIAVDPQNAHAFSNRGFAYVRKNISEKALQDFNRAIEIDPKDIAAFFGRGRIFARTAQYDRAISDFTHVIQFGPENASPFVGRSLAHLARGDLQLSLADCEEAIRLVPTRKDLIENRGLVYLRQNRATLALADFETALQFNPKLPWSLFARGVIRLRQGDSRGSADIAAAQRIQPDVANDLGRYGIRR